MYSRPGPYLIAKDTINIKKREFTRHQLFVQPAPETITKIITSDPLRITEGGIWGSCGPRQF